MTDNGSLDGNTDTAGGMQQSTRVSEGLATAPTAVPATTPVVRFAAGTVCGLDSPTATVVTETNPLTTPQGYFAIQLRKITQRFSAGLGIPQSLEVLLTLAGTPKCVAGTQPTPRTGQGAGTPTIPGMAVLAPGQQQAEYRATSQPNQYTKAAGNTDSPNGRGNVVIVQARAADRTLEFAIQMAAED